jgi:hypothetical protein
VFKALGLAALMMAMATTARGQETRVEIPCPVMLVSGHLRGNAIELSFRNKGKVPLQQVSLGCSPAMAGRARDAICHTESGLFYPGTPYTMTFAYTGARRGAVTISVKGARLGTGGVVDGSECPGLPGVGGASEVE